jgi:hypothetical protein
MTPQERDMLPDYLYPEVSKDGPAALFPNEFQGTTFSAQSSYDADDGPSAPPAVDASRQSLTAHRKQVNFEEQGFEGASTVSTADPSKDPEALFLTWHVPLDRYRGSKLGISVAPVGDNQWLRVSNLTDPEGVVERWNGENPDQAVRVGDLIISVNGASGDTDVLVRECQKEGDILDVVVARPAGM